MINLKDTLIEHHNLTEEKLYQNLVESMYNKDYNFTFSEEELDILIHQFHRAYDFEVANNENIVRINKLKKESKGAYQNS